VRAEPEQNQFVFDYQAAYIHRQTIISFSQKAELQDRTATFEVTVPPKGDWQTCIWITPMWDLVPARPKYGCDAFGKATPESTGSLPEWQAQLPVLHSDDETLTKTFAQSVIDLAALRFYPERRDHPVLAAGLPWYMALFGRDNLITAYQCCYAVPSLAACALRALARLQGTKVDDFRDEEPGKIPHEQRFGELTLLGESPHSPYYGTVDATPLFLILLHEVYRWTLDRGLITELQEPALRALAWIDRYGDADGDGYVEYVKRSPKGLDNHCWKDSPTSIVFQDGTLATPPIAVAEVQGYVYDAKLRLAELAEQVWQELELARRLRQEAAALRARFNRDFWIPRQGGYFALALDRDKRQVDSMTSNMGHLLWSGIVDADKAPRVVRQLTGEHLDSGWGIRTLSTLDKGFNPIAYHAGTVWPHDNSLIAAGLARYGYRDEANRIIQGMLDVARYFDYRLPEVFAGFQRSQISFPVEYPTASSPQAWATGAAMLFVRILLGLEPETGRGGVTLDPALPAGLGYVRLENMPVFGRRFHVDSRDGRQGGLAA
jgi:glycogen debranching enzyme